MNEYIKILPGKLLKADGSQTNILDALGVSVSPMTVRNDGYKHPEIAAIVIGENQYALADILEAIGEKMGGASTLADLTDTNIVTPSTGQVLKYNNTSKKWNNVTHTNAPTVYDANGILAYTANNSPVDAENYIYRMNLDGMLIYMESATCIYPLSGIVYNNDDTITCSFGSISYTTDLTDGLLHRDT